MLRALRSPAASSSRAGGATTTANVGAPRHPMKAWDADPSRAAVAFRGITTKSPLEAELEQQRAVEEMERALLLELRFERGLGGLSLIHI